MARGFELTHDECCRLVEGSIERGLQTLLYIRERLGQKGVMDEWQEKSCAYMNDVLCNINHYGAYLSGARAMCLALEEQGLLATPKKTHTYGGRRYVDNDSGLSDKEQRIVNKALLKLYLDSPRNMEWLLQGGTPGNAELRVKCGRDKRGKVTDAVASFVRKETTYKEI